MADPDQSPAFLSVVPAAFAEMHPPLVYQLLRGVEPGARRPHRYVRSEPYRADGYACTPFHRPLSKLVPED